MREETINQGAGIGPAQAQEQTAQGGGGRGFHQRGVTAMKVHITMFISDFSITLWDEKDGDGVTERQRCPLNVSLFHPHSNFSPCCPWYDVHPSIPPIPLPNLRQGCPRSLHSNRPLPPYLRNRLLTSSILCIFRGMATANQRAVVATVNGSIPALHLTQPVC